MPVVINKKAKEALFANISPIGKVLNVDDDSQLKIVGVVENFKAKGEFMENEPCVFVLPEEKSYNSTILIKVRPGTDANFECKIDEGYHQYDQRLGGRGELPDRPAPESIESHPRPGDHFFSIHF